jgi:hypothetical protein
MGRAVDDRDAIDSRAFRRWQTILAFTRGSRQADAAPARRPNRPLAAGVAVTLAICLVVGVRGLLDQRPAADWRAEGTLLVDRAAGERYLVVHGLLRPVLNLTSLKLFTGGPLPRSVQVSHALLAAQPHGGPLGIAAAPDEPPTLLDRQAPWVACEGGRGELDLVAGLPGGLAPADPGAPGGILARARGDPQVRLVTGAGAYRLAPAALGRLGYTPDLIRTVPRRWLDLLPQQPTLDLLPLPRGPGGAPAAAFMADGTIVADQRSGVQYLAGGGALHRILNHTSVLLLDHPTAGPVQAAADAIAAQPQGRPFGIAGAPASPPAVPEGTSPLFACAASDGAAVRVLPRPPLGGGLARALPPAGVPRPAPGERLWMVPGRGVLARPRGAPPADVSRRAPLYLVTAGAAYPVVSQAALGALGYGAEQARTLPPRWLAALPRGPALVSPRTGR